VDNSKITYWTELSDYDIESAQVMLDGARYLYVGFMCHQAIEKILKAYYTAKNNNIPPYTHNLTKLSELAGLNDLFDETKKEFLFSIQPLNIEARYPSYKENLLKMLNRENTSQILKKTKEFQLWVKQMLSKI
jgi:HEPN domain-containing protein